VTFAPVPPLMVSPTPPKIVSLPALPPVIDSFWAKPLIS
jgi:hypothetical protein